jgi:transposase
MYLKEVVQKTKKNQKRRYLQFVESVRTEKGPRQNILVNLGRIDDKDGKERLEVLTESLLKLSEQIHVLDIEKDVAGGTAKQLGLEMAFRRLFDQIGMSKTFERVFSDINTDFDVRDALFNMVLNRLGEPASKHGIGEWQTDQYGLKHYSLHQYYRTMDYLHDHQEDLEDKIYKQMKSLSTARKSDLSIALFDTTSVVYYGDGDEEESFLDFGFSKKRRSDLKQIVVGVAMTKDGIPISHEAYSGNTNDVTCFKQIIEKFSEKHGEDKVTFVGDRGLITNSNLSLLVESGYKYILGFRMRTIPKDERADIINKSGLKKLKKDMEYCELEYKGKRLIVYYNEERAEKDKVKRDEILDRIKEKIKGGTIKSIVSNKDYKKFLSIEGKSPRLDQDKIDADAVFDGVFILTTNAKISASEAMNTYRSLWQCEAGFRTLKSELDLEPLYHRKERRIRSHVFICFLALILKNMFIKKARLVEKEASYRKMMLDLKRLQAITFKLHKTEITARTEIGEHAKLAFKALKMAYPKKVLAHSNENMLALHN